MSITSDLKNYVDQTVATAQAQLNEVAGTANEYVGKYRDNVGDIADKANEAVNDLRVTAEKAINIDALRTAIEPYLAQVREYGSVVTDRAEGLLNGVKDDPRLSKFVETANSVSSVVIEQVNEYVVKPVQSFTGLGVKPAAKPSAPKASKPATTKPATAKPATATATTAKATTAKATTTKPAARPAAAKPSTPAKKATPAARKTTTRTTTTRTTKA